MLRKVKLIVTSTSSHNEYRNNIINLRKILTKDTTVYIYRVYYFQKASMLNTYTSWYTKHNHYNSNANMDEMQVCKACKG